MCLAEEYRALRDFVACSSVDSSSSSVFGDPYACVRLQTQFYRKSAADGGDGPPPELPQAEAAAN